MSNPDDPFDIHEVPRDRYGRPLIKQPDGKAKAYTRCTTYVGCLEDTFNLAQWQQRMVALGLASRPDLLLAVSAHSDDKRRLNDICTEAREAAAASSAATTGTALHRLAERLDRGEQVPIPSMAAADLEAYQRATQGIRWLHIEQITVHDGLQVAGTPDRIGVGPDGKARVYDIKTGSVDYGMGKIAMQMAMYAHSSLYNVVSGIRTPLDVDLTSAVVIHLPAGQGRCELLEVDIDAGWQAVQLATQVREWRNRKDLARPVAQAVEPTWAERVAAASSIGDLMDLYSKAVDAGVWDDTLRALFGQRKAELQVAA